MRDALGKARERKKGGAYYYPGGGGGLRGERGRGEESRRFKSLSKKDID